MVKNITNLQIKYILSTIEQYFVMILVRNQQLKQNKPCRFAISFKLFTLFQKLVQKVVKKPPKYESTLYISTELPVN